MPKLGMIEPNMGKTTTSPSSAYTSPADALFSGTRQRLLAWLFGQPHRSFYSNELIGLTQSGSGAVQRELAQLSQSGLVTTRMVGNQRHFQANANAPIYNELCGIVRKTVGLAEPLRQALSPLAQKIDAAFVYGSVATQSDTAASDIDVMVLTSSLTYAEVFESLETAQQTLGRTINPTLISRQQFKKRMKANESFLTRVMSKPKLWIIGGEDALTL